MEKKKSKKSCVIIGSIVVIALLGGYMLMSVSTSSADDNITYQAYIAQKGNVVSSVTGNGILMNTDSVYMKTVNGLMVTDVPVEEGDWINKGDVLAQLDPVTVEVQIAYYTFKVEECDKKLASLNNSAEKIIISAERNAYVQLLEIASSYIDDPCIRSEVDGVLSHYFLIEGVETGLDEENMSKRISENESLVADISIGGVTKMTIAIDEKDIGKVEVGQEATMILDAFPTERFVSTVTEKSYTGDSQSSVTTYAVDLTFDNDNRFLVGMNSSANINVASKNDVVLVPVNAIIEDVNGTYLYISPNGLEDGSDKVLTPIKTGLSDGRFVEIIEGVATGDMIIQVIVGKDADSVSMFMGGGLKRGTMGGGEGNGRP